MRPISRQEIHELPTVLDEQEVVIALVLGPLAEFSAIAVVEVSYEQRGFNRTDSDPRFKGWDQVPIFQVPYVERWQSTYQESLERCKRVVEHPRFISADSEVVLDLSVAGMPVFELASSIGLDTLPVEVTAGGIEDRHSGITRVPRKTMVSAAVVAFQARTVRVAEIDEADQLMSELETLRSKPPRPPGESFEQWDEAITESMARAVALGLWRASQLCEIEREYDEPYEVKPHDLMDQLGGTW